MLAELIFSLMIFGGFLRFPVHGSCHLQVDLVNSPPPELWLVSSTVGRGDENTHPCLASGHRGAF